MLELESEFLLSSSTFFFNSLNMLKCYEKRELVELNDGIINLCSIPTLPLRGVDFCLSMPIPPLFCKKYESILPVNPLALDFPLFTYLMSPPRDDS